MLIEVLLFFILGSALGILAGLVPGLHPNTVLIMLLPFSLAAASQGSYPLIAMAVSIAVTNTIVNFIPSIFLGAPDPGTALSVLPGHRFLLRGAGYEALFLTVIGGVFVTVLMVPALPFLLWFIPFVYASIHTYIHWLLLGTLFVLLWKEKRGKKMTSLLIFLVSGAAGSMLLSSVPSEAVIFPALTGLFGLSIIITSILQTTSIPVQKIGTKLRCRFLKGTVAGWLAGMFVGILPGIGSAQAGVLANAAVRGKEKDFLVALGGINTSNIIFTFIALHSISKTRSGAAVFLSEIVPNLGTSEVIFVVMLALLSCFFSAFVTLTAGRHAIRLLFRLDYRKINAAVLLFLIIMTFAFSGLYGLIIALLCTAVGLSCAGLGVKRMYLMGFLMMPAILHFSGLFPSLLALF
jgi:putative membrane protein